MGQTKLVNPRGFSEILSERITSHLKQWLTKSSKEWSIIKISATRRVEIKFAKVRPERLIIAQRKGN